MTADVGHRGLPGMAGIVCALPCLLVTLGVLAFTVSELVGGYPLSLGPTRNMAEAAGLGRGAEVLRVLRNGGDAHQLVSIRPEVISSRITRVTALEAAVFSRRVQVIELLDDHGAIRDAGERRHLACLADDLSASDIAAYLAPAERPACVRGQTVEAIADRSRVDATAEHSR